MRRCHYECHYNLPLSPTYPTSILPSKYVVAIGLWGAQLTFPFLSVISPSLSNHFFSTHIVEKCGNNIFRPVRLSDSLNNLGAYPPRLRDNRRLRGQVLPRRAQIRYETTRPKCPVSSHEGGEGEGGVRCGCGSCDRCQLMSIISAAADTVWRRAGRAYWPYTSINIVSTRSQSLWTFHGKTWSRQFSASAPRACLLLSPPIGLEDRASRR